MKKIINKPVGATRKNNTLKIILLLALGGFVAMLVKEDVGNMKKQFMIGFYKGYSGK